MKETGLKRGFVWRFLIAALVFMSPTTALAEGYSSALKNINGTHAVYDVSLGSPKMANVVFWAVRNSYQAPEIMALPEPSTTVIVFHGLAVKLLSTDKSLFTGADWEEVEKFQQTLREMKAAGVKMEVCLYAAKVLGIDKATIIQEVDHVDNGFVSVIGYQMQGYAVVRVP